MRKEDIANHINFYILDNYTFKDIDPSTKDIIINELHYAYLTLGLKIDKRLSFYFQPIDSIKQPTSLCFREAKEHIEEDKSLSDIVSIDTACLNHVELTACIIIYEFFYHSYAKYASNQPDPSQALINTLIYGFLRELDPIVLNHIINIDYPNIFHDYMNNIFFLFRNPDIDFFFEVHNKYGTFAPSGQLSDYIVQVYTTRLLEMYYNKQIYQTAYSGNNKYSEFTDLDFFDFLNPDFFFYHLCSKSSDIKTLLPAYLKYAKDAQIEDNLTDDECIAMNELPYERLFQIFYESNVTAYENILRNYTTESMPINKGSLTKFTLLPYNLKNLYCGNFHATDKGIFQETKKETDTAVDYRQCCANPVTIAKLNRNTDTDTAIVEIAYNINGVWNLRLFNLSSLQSAKTLASKLLDLGVIIINQRLFKDYIMNLLRFNQDAIRTELVTDRLGWHDDEFIPYSMKYKLHCAGNPILKSVHRHGSYTKWVETMRKYRKESLEFRYALAATFCSVLLDKVDDNGFWVEFNSQSGSGKSVMLKACASIWGNPDDYIQDFRSTILGLEEEATSLNSLPFILDDASDISWDIRKDLDSVVYMLCNSSPKSRSRYSTRGYKVQKWKLCVISTGEERLSNLGNITAGGALNRIVSITTKPTIFESPVELIETSKENYGHAGSDFIDIIKKIDFRDLKSSYKVFYDIISSTGLHSKRVNSIALILLADYLTEIHIFKDNLRFPVADAINRITEKTPRSKPEQLYHNIASWYNSNLELFPSEIGINDTPVSNMAGIIDSSNDTYMVLCPNSFTQLCVSENISVREAEKYLKDHGLLKTDKGYKKNKRVYGKLIPLYYIKKPSTITAKSPADAVKTDGLYDEDKIYMALSHLTDNRSITKAIINDPEIETIYEHISTPENTDKRLTMYMLNLF